MPLEFHKMHGAGNDFVLIDAREQDFTASRETARQIADRRLGVGCDQLLVLRPAEDPAQRVRYDIWNADGSTAGQCGNGARCVGLYLELNGEAADHPFSVQSPAGPVSLRRCTDGEFEVDMGHPRFAPNDIPIALDPDGHRYHLDSPWGRLEFGTASLGNPHALIQTDNIEDAQIPDIGAYLSTQPVFPEGCNIGFAQVEAEDRIRLRVVERGAGETPACGSGACAAVAILHRAGRVGDAVEVLLPGGRLMIKWRGNGGPLTMKGPAVHVFRGAIDD
ncbi:MAG: diaminopimelate epimerase [Xanthomonadales bacterium]|nr:diaminopimelate epimerase [Xanthomonadales bacterium]